MSWRRHINQLPQYKLLAIRVLIACIIAIIVTEMIGLQRNYWSVLAIISISISVHAREILFRSKSIVIHTVLGCFVGTLAYYYLSLELPFYVLICVILALSLFTLYFSVVHYSVGVFFSSVFIVMFVGALSYWDLSLFRARIFDIAIGAVAILAVSLIIKPNNLKHKLSTKAYQIYLAHKQIIEILVAVNLEDEITKETLDKKTIKLLVDDLIMQEKKLVEHFINTKIELSDEQIKLMKLLFSTMQELVVIYQSCLSLGTSENDVKLRRFCQQKLQAFFLLLQEEYLAFEKSME
ncbi:FUSC family protein [Fastidiosibacter lacustris]|uniref:FUSC family protein n=1 Tax=Fastidiosibacter lacustris TaxID=2056695 RepID=UPI000E34C448|nr:FUSC family protein [Fastidiosibacter lacustris]